MQRSLCLEFQHLQGCKGGKECWVAECLNSSTCMKRLMNSLVIPSDATVNTLLHFNDKKKQIK